jgi:hydroxymethylpyrimidine pyrophosphatase-like HAD family hydrolase
VLYNGSIVATYDAPGEPLLHRTIPLKALVDIIKLAVPARASVYAYQFADYTLGLVRDRVIGWSDVGGPQHDTNGLTIDWPNPQTNLPNVPPTTVLIALGNNHFDTSVREGLARIAGVTVTSSGGTYLEVRPEGSDKAAALRLITATLGIRREEVLAIGDNDNDKEMLRWSGIGVAVRGASTSATTAADYVSRHTDAAGVNETLHVVRSAIRYFQPTPQKRAQ